MVDVVQWLERQVVALEIVGSSPTIHPIFTPWATRCERALGRGQAVRHETLTLAFAGSTPAAPAMFDPLAQLAEHLTFNQGVRSSNLRWVTMKNRSFLMMRDGRFCFMRAWDLRIRLCFCKARFPHFHLRPKRAQDGRKDRLPRRNLRGFFRRALSCRLFALCKFSWSCPAKHALPNAVCSCHPRPIHAVW